jgi:Regulator of Chromosome Condensation (RCC1) repeat protein
MKRLLPLLLVCACAGSLVDHDGASSATPDSGLPPTQACLETCQAPPGSPLGTVRRCEGDFCTYDCPSGLGLLKTPLTNPPSCSVPTAVAAGGNHTCAIAAGGVVCWGDNSLNELGFPSPATSPTPVQVPGLPPAADRITASTTQTCAHFGNGAVWCWGAGQAPHAIDGIGGTVNAIAAGASHACAATDSAVWCWGDNSLGQLGAAPDAGHATPAPVSGVPGAKVLAAGQNHTCAGDTTGSQLYCWGDNGAGQNGTGGNTSPSLPAVVQGAGASFVAAGENHTCSISASGSLSCWGANGTNQVDGSKGDVTRPKGESSSATGAAGGAGHTCDIENGGAAVICRGLNDEGQLGAGNADVTTNPVQVVGSLTDVASITAGSKHTCALTKDRKLSCWGANELGQLGTGTGIGLSPVPLPVTSL